MTPKGPRLNGRRGRSLKSDWRSVREFKDLGVVLKCDYYSPEGAAEIEEYDPELHIQTYLEVKFYTEILRLKDRKWFVKVLGHGVLPNGAYWILEERVKLLPGFPPRVVFDQLLPAIKRYHLQDLNPYYARNWGIREEDRTPFIYDFGLYEAPGD